MANLLTDEIISTPRYLAEILKVIKLGSGTAQTLSISTFSSGTTLTIPAGATSVEFHPTDNFNGQIAGTAYLGAAWQVIGPFTAAPGKTLGPIEISRSQGSVNILKVV
jgi:hypothetical protein